MSAARPARKPADAPPPMPKAGPWKGFTLLELLVAVSLIAILAGMLFPLVIIARRQGRIANTKATLLKVDQAIRLFRTDMRAYPWQVDLGTAPAGPDAWTNDLAWRLAWNPPPAGSGTPAKPDRATYIAGFQRDIRAISRSFAFVNGCNVPPSGDQSEGSHAFRNELQTAASRTNLLPAWNTSQDTLAQINGGSKYFPGTAGLGLDCTSEARALTKMAEEVTKLAYIAGQLPTLAPTGIDAALPEDKARFPCEDERHRSFQVSLSPAIPFRYFPYNGSGANGDDRRGPVLTEATAKARGWRGDYLASAINADGSANQRLDVDASGEAILDAWGRPLIYVCTVRTGIHGYMQALTTTIYHGAREDRYRMGPQGRDPTTFLASDIRTTAAAPYVHEFELWSAGPDGRFAAARDDLVNRDNVALLPYLRGLQP